MKPVLVTEIHRRGPARGRSLTITWLAGMIVPVTLALTACGDSTPTPQAPSIDRALGDESLRTQLVERGAADEEFVHQILENFSLRPGGDEKLAEILTAHFEHHPETARAVFRRLKSQPDFQTWSSEQVEGE